MAAAPNRALGCPRNGIVDAVLVPAAPSRAGMTTTSQRATRSVESTSRPHRATDVAVFPRPTTFSTCGGTRQPRRARRRAAWNEARSAQTMPFTPPSRDGSSAAYLSALDAPHQVVVASQGCVRQPFVVGSNRLSNAAGQNDARRHDLAPAITTPSNLPGRSLRADLLGAKGSEDFARPITALVRALGRSTSVVGLAWRTERL
jgi:hypothetical protein